jgi:hypothetical protein
MSEEESGVLISDGHYRVRLTRAGEPHELGYPTIIELKAGPFRGTLSDSLLDYGRFLAQLNAMHETLSGDAKLGSYEGFELDLIGSGVELKSASKRSVSTSL